MFVKLADKFGFDFIETSAKTGDHVREIFEGLCESIVESRRSLQAATTTSSNTTHGMHSNANGTNNGLNLTLTLNSAMDSIQDFYKNSSSAVPSRVSCCV